MAAKTLQHFNTFMHMKYVIYLFSVALLLTYSCARSKDEFVVGRNRLDMDYRMRIDSLKTNRPSFFEDEKYVVTRTCYGEWGGIIIFHNKDSGVEYVSGSTCAIAVNKLKGKFFITNTLAHMGGFSEVLEIDDPDSLNFFHGGGEEKIDRYMELSASRKGTTQLLDTTGVLTIGTFPYHDELYHVVTDYKRTYLARIQDRKLIPVKQIAGENLWTKNIDVIRVENDHYVMAIPSGYLDVSGNVITILTNNP